MSSSNIVVVARRRYQFLNHDCGAHGVQITKIRCGIAVGFVREWRRGRPGESFHMSSNARLGHKADGNRIGREVLELAIDKRCFAKAATAICELDGLERDVLSSNRWALKYAAWVWTQAEPIEDKLTERTEEMGMKPRKKPSGREAIDKVLATRKREAKKEAKKNGIPMGPRLDKKNHKLVAGKKAACGKQAGEMNAGVWSGGVDATDTWHFVDCKECLALMPETIHQANFKPAAMFGVMRVYDDNNGDRWKAETNCKLKKSPLETTTDTNGGINCLDCLSLIAPNYRQHFQPPGGKQTTTLCGARTNSIIPYSTDCWWLVTCPDCYRISAADAVHPLQEEDVKLMLHNSMVAARNQSMTPSQNSCHICDVTTAGTCCLACAVLRRRNSDPKNKGVENELSRILGLPYEWVMDLLKGWDGDKSPELTYPTAFKLGKKLWRKHG